MISLVLQKQKEKKYIIMAISFFIGFMVIYTILDNLNMTYKEMISEHGLYLPVINILINILMSGMSAVMFNFSTALGEINNQRDKGGSIPILSVIFGIFTYGCTSCVVTFLGAIGILFTPPTLGLAMGIDGLMFKLISIVLLTLGLLWVLRSIKRSVCKI